MMKKTGLGNKLFYIGFLLYCTATFLQTTMLVENAAAERLFVYMRYLAFALGFAQVVKNWIAPERGIAPIRKKTERKRAVWCMILLLVAGVSSLVSHDRTFLACVLFIMASERAGHRRMFRITFLFLVCGTAFVMLLAGTGVIPDLMFKRQDIPVRHSLGFNYPSMAMSCLFFIVTIYLWLRSMEITAAELAVIELVNFAMYRLTDARFGFLMIALLPVIVYLWNRASVRKRIRNLAGGRLLPVIGRLADSTGLLLTVLLFLMIALLPTGLGQLLDRLLTGRLGYARAALQNYGVHLFGNRIEWIGFGGSYDTDSLLAEYNYVDNSYGFLLLNFGILVLIMILAMLYVTARRARLEYTDGRALLVVWMMLYCFVEPRLADIYLNPFLFLAAPFVCGRRKRIRKRMGGRT